MVKIIDVKIEAKPRKSASELLTALVGQNMSKNLLDQANNIIAELDHELYTRRLDSINFPYVNHITDDDLKFFNESITAYKIYYAVKNQCRDVGIDD